MLAYRLLRCPTGHETLDEFVVGWSDRTDKHMREAIDALTETLREHGIYSGSDLLYRSAYRVDNQAVLRMTEQERQDYYYGDPVQIPEEYLHESNDPLVLFCTADGKTARLELLESRWNDEGVVHTLDLGDLLAC